MSGRRKFLAGVIFFLLPLTSLLAVDLVVADNQVPEWYEQVTEEYFVSETGRAELEDDIASDIRAVPALTQWYGEADELAVRIVMTNAFEAEFLSYGPRIAERYRGDSTVLLGLDLSGAITEAAFEPELATAMEGLSYSQGVEQEDGRIIDVWSTLLSIGWLVLAAFSALLGVVLVAVTSQPRLLASSFGFVGAFLVGVQAVVVWYVEREVTNSGPTGPVFAELTIPRWWSLTLLMALLAAVSIMVHFGWGVVLRGRRERSLRIVEPQDRSLDAIYRGRSLPDVDEDAYISRGA